MTPVIRPSWSLVSAEFRCRGCGAHEAVRSRPRGFFEAYVLPIFFLQPVRCDRCYLRSYVSRSVSPRERTQRERVQPGSRRDTAPDNKTRIA